MEESPGLWKSQKHLGTLENVQMVVVWTFDFDVPPRIIRILCGHFAHQRRVIFEDTEGSNSGRGGAVGDKTPDSETHESR